ncbi:hypothetical protein SDRG_07493 [Saprolegnia diclina VS20]|uniref:N-acetyltransferase domain-containing protein n=1 Tax=Saprolegnia diclina (strain VS20) TaxID=1156394 RepID=T0RY10_SAPDV|nr:hypothetical protein SDRG_07493 [Saprolegnia diclina VS20]EQC35267.1 hypothetical protein SDRG_07493 [Saprolegnia diclina VS20]|eukprot:XP_008611551.1 hypothetical protein SDRG_07493 [Saprolegnia diclina VS20]
MPSMTHKALHAASVQAMLWDEAISMAVAQAVEPTKSHSFYQLAKPASILLLDHDSDNIAESMRHLLASLDASQTPAIETMFPTPLPADAGLKAFGFVRSAGQTIRAMAPLRDTTEESPCQPGLRVCRVLSLDDAEWADRLRIEAILFGYPPTGYVDRLRVALAQMFSRDVHWLAYDDNAVVGYMTLRYTRGVAYLQGAGVLATHRRRGLTRHLLSLAILDAMDKKYTTMVTTGCDAPAEATWTALGFTQVVGTLESYSRPPSASVSA